MFVDFPAIILLLISTLIPLRSENILYMIYLLNVLKCILWLRMWSVLVNVPCKLEKNACSAVVRLSVL